MDWIKKKKQKEQINHKPIRQGQIIKPGHGDTISFQSKR